jgi:hypothetical protein
MTRLLDIGNAISGLGAVVLLVLTTKRFDTGFRGKLPANYRTNKSCGGGTVSHPGCCEVDPQEQRGRDEPEAGSTKWSNPSHPC